jgi:hypothetical protein
MRDVLRSIRVATAVGALLVSASVLGTATGAAPRAGAGAGSGPAAQTGKRPAVTVPGTWTAVASPNPFSSINPANELVGVSCGSATFCVAVGNSYEVDNATSNQIAAQWGGSSWTEISALTPAPTTTNSWLNGVSCVSATFCMVVGTVQSGSTYTAEAQVWDGSGWGSLPGPAGAASSWGNTLTAVSCSSATFCVALDRYNAPLTPTQYLIEQWNGTSWSPTAPPALTAGDSLWGISCVDQSCQAVGQDANFNPLDFALGGGIWGEVAMPAGTTQSGLNSVSCASPTMCVAVGFQYYNNHLNPSLNDQYSVNLVEQWNGSNWSTASVPDANSSWGDGLDTVDCFGPTSCVAGGWVYTASEGSSSSNQVLAWNGTSWALQSAPAPVGAGYSQIDGMDCVANRLCLAVGFSDQTTQALTASAVRPGYYEVGSDGGIFNFGVPFFGSMGGHPLNEPVVGMAVTPDGGGYWLVASDGGIFCFGDALFYGSTGGTTLNKPIVAMVPTPDGGGYWLVGSDGGIFSFGDALFYGSTGGITLNKPVVGMATTADGRGYWLVGSDGGIFCYGDAVFYGSTGGLTLNNPVVGMAASADAMGYWLVGSDGGIFSFGDAVFYGSTAGLTLNRPVVGMAEDPTEGYWLVASDGGIFCFNAPFLGSMGGQPLNAPIVAIAQ